MTRLAIALAAALVFVLAVERLRTWNGPPPARSFESQGVGSRHGGMGNMGGGSGRSANTGIGLGGLGASQGARN